MSIPSFTLQRIEQTSFATYGELRDSEGHRVCLALELPWFGNMHNVSCIPAGIYGAVRYHSPKRGIDVFMLCDVPDRSAIEIHVANVPSELMGCIALGSNWYEFPNGKGVTGSAAAFAKFMNRLVGVDRITLTVRDVEASV